MTQDLIQDELKRKAKALGLSEIQHHIFLCCDQTNPKCCNREQGLESWEYLKSRIHQLAAEGKVGIYRTKANCLRVCMQGPIAVIYPDGIWYHSCTPEVLELILQQHILGGKVVQEYQIDKNYD